MMLYRRSGVKIPVLRGCAVNGPEVSEKRNKKSTVKKEKGKG